eukprot:1913181-Rhodomonas_salina.1
MVEYVLLSEEKSAYDDCSKQAESVCAEVDQTETQRKKDSGDNASERGQAARILFEARAPTPRARAEARPGGAGA